MKLILRSDRKGLGKRGDIVEVADGYGRNFLLPKGHAFTATDGQTLARFFLNQSLCVGGAMLVLLMCVPWLKRLMGGVK